MGGHCVLRDIEQPRHLSGGEAVWLVANDQAKGVKPGCLGERSEDVDGVGIFHASRIIDMTIARQVNLL